MNWGLFLNGFVCDLQTLFTIVAFLLIFWAFFGWQYDAWMTKLGERKEGYVAILVVVGVLATLLGVAAISWKAAVLSLGGFVVTGSFMIAGDVRRYVNYREELTQTRRKPLPYAANALLDEVLMTVRDAQKDVEAVLNDEEMKPDAMFRKVASVSSHLAVMVEKVWEIKKGRLD